MSILLGILTFVLILVSIFLVLVVLAQKTKDGGVGGALGGGATEAAFGAETGNVLTTMTKYSAILFFVLAFALYLGRLYERKHGGFGAAGSLPVIAAPATPPAPAPTTATSTPGAPAANGSAITVPSATPATAPASTAPATTAPATPAPEAAKKP